MLAVHWSPVKNTKKIIRAGIKSRGSRGVYCFPLTGHWLVDRQWVRILRQSDRTQYNGFLFRLLESDMPATFNDYLHGDTRRILTLEELENRFRNRLSESANNYYAVQNKTNPGPAKERTSIDQNKLVNEFLREPERMFWCWKNDQIVLSNPIEPSRIIRVISSNGSRFRKRFEDVSNSEDYEA